MNKTIDLAEMIPLMKEQLDAGKTVSFVPNGKSMEPMLDGGKDMIVLKKPEGRLHFQDVAMYYRRETGKYIVHRVVKVMKDGTYVMLGDNNFEREYNIGEDDIIGVVVNYYHKGKMRSVTSGTYRFYCDFWYYSRPFRHFGRRVKLSLKKRLGKEDQVGR